MSLSTHPSKNTATALNVIILFSLGVPLRTWQTAGLAAREKAYYDRIVEQGHQVSLLTYGKDDLDYQQLWHPIKILPWVGRINHFVKYACVAPFYHRQAFQKAKIVKSNQSQGSLVAVLGKLINPKLKFVLRCGWVRTKEVIRQEEKRTGMKYYRAVFFEWLAVKLANAIVVVTQSDADYLIEHYAAKREKIHIIPNSINTRQYQFHATQLSEPLTSKPVVKVLMVGRLVEAKNFHKVFAAVAELNASIEMTLIGDGDYRATLEQLASDLNVSATFLGSVANDELAAHYAENDLVIMPEAWGSGMPKVVLESMAAGALIIASNIRSVRQVLRHTENGLICEPTQSSIKENLHKALTMDAQQFSQIVTTARQEVENRYSMDAAVEQELALYQTLLSKRT